MMNKFIINRTVNYQRIMNDIHMINSTEYAMSDIRWTKQKHDPTLMG